MLRPYRREPAYREDFVILRLLSASKSMSEQTFLPAGKQPVGICGKIEGS